VAAAMKDIVLVALAIDAETGEIDPTAPFVVIAKRPQSRRIDDKENQFRVAALVVLGTAGRGTA
jgi:hypothetical protein